MKQKWNLATFVRIASVPAAISKDTSFFGMSVQVEISQSFSN